MDSERLASSRFQMELVLIFFIYVILRKAIVNVMYFVVIRSVCHNFKDTAKSVLPLIRAFV